MEALIHIAYTVNLSEGTVSPFEPQYAGVQGDHRAAYVSFQIPEALRTDGCRYYIESCDGSGAHLLSEPLTCGTDGTVGLWLDRRMTAAGGQTVLRLCIAETADSESPHVLHSFDARVYFAGTACPQAQAEADTEYVLNASLLRSLSDGETAGSVRGVHALEETDYALGENAVALGLSTVADQDNQLAVGQYGRSEEGALLTVGNGTAADARSNALCVHRSGTVALGADPVGEADAVTKRYADRKAAEEAAKALPVIGDNGNWSVAGRDTGRAARGSGWRMTVNPYAETAPVTGDFYLVTGESAQAAPWDVFTCTAAGWSKCGSIRGGNDGLLVTDATAGKSYVLKFRMADGKPVIVYDEV